MRLIDAEETDWIRDANHPCVSVGFLSDPKFARRLTTGEVSLAHVVDLTRGSDGDAIRRRSTRQEGQLVIRLRSTCCS
jgi:hypothetical protein